ncbi:hypothetical protein CYMTET_45555 [Cymbomonas tetramitiformis]|uniref:Nucleotide-diphospho-sugar transferase domain-containing protein n=1 Tax=Cymbomonas tetramitiformis TaxID=36881 RepID=A0AAE0BZT1_9CHLO|nr:hypothetical protein CYMTET_45555 [Cymbomonas tetramitiformis]|eukprot:gene17733-21125_t
MLTFGSKAVTDFILNWVYNVEKIPSLKPYIVAVMDEELLRVCREKGIPAFHAQNSNIIGDKENLGGAVGQEKQVVSADKYYRQDGAAFKKMGAVKARVLQDLLEAGYNVFVSDADTVWFSDPWDIVGKEGVPSRSDSKLLREADILVSTDCIDYSEDLGPGLAAHEHNTGILWLRSTPSTIAFTKEWQVRALATTDGHDQTEFNRILKGWYEPGVEGRLSRDSGLDFPYMPAYVNEQDILVPTDPQRDLTVHGDKRMGMRPQMLEKAWNTFNRHKQQNIRDIYWMWRGRLKAAILPMAEFLNGHMYFTRRVQEYPGAAQPKVVHLTYQFGDTADYVYGKRQRLRELGMWEMEEADYFSKDDYIYITDVGSLCPASMPFLITL